MAEGIITLVVDKLGKVAATEIASLLGLTKELDNLYSEFSAIKKVLQDAETRQIGDEYVRGWLQKLKRVAYDLNDLLEEWIICFGDHQELPEGIFEMASLRQLNVEKCNKLKKFPDGIGRRKDVVVIFDRFPVVAAGGNSGGCSRSNIGELGGMNMRAEYLDICNLKEVGSIDEARTAKLEEKTSVVSLVLSWNDTSCLDYLALSWNDTHVAVDGVLEGLRPPPHLFYLKIRHYPGQAFPGWIGDSAAFCHLAKVELWYCKNCTQLPPLGQLPSLTSLTIAGLDGVERVGREFFGGPSPTFPCLTSLTFDEMKNWSEWVALSPIRSEDEEGTAKSPIMPALDSLKFIDCPLLSSLPEELTKLVALRKLTIDDCPELSGRCRVDPKIAHIPLIQIDGEYIQI